MTYVIHFCVKYGNEFYEETSEKEQEFIKEAATVVNAYKNLYSYI